MMLIQACYEVYKRMWLTEIYNRLRYELAIDVSKMLATEERANKHYLNVVLADQATKPHISYTTTLPAVPSHSLKLVVYRPEARHDGR
jgi:hypothetical protein